jgi:hypothetical protein
MARDEAPPFGRGETYYNGTPKDPVFADPLHLLGKEYVFEVNSEGINQDASPNPYDPSGRAVRVRVAQNKSGVNLKPARLARFKLEDPYGTTVDGYTTGIADRPAGVVDEFLPPAGVADGDLFYLVVDGPSKVTQASASAAVLAIGDVLVPATGTSNTNDDAGRVAKQDVSGAAATLANNLASRVGFASVANNSVEDAVVPALVKLV